jgi:hepatocyte growth factor-regulated tyrosine kinase substrate
MTQVVKKVHLPLPFAVVCLPDSNTVSSGLLNEMNDKLAQAVKLYDQILTQQVSRPTWRQQTASPPRQPQDQWNYVQALTSPQLTNASVTPALHQPSSTYTSSQAHPPSARADTLLPQSPQQTWSQSSFVPSAASPPPLVTAPEINPQHHTAATLQSPTSYQYQYAHPIKPVSIQQLAPPAPLPGQVITPPQHPVTSVSAQSASVHQQVSSPPPVPHHQRPRLQQPPSRHNAIVHVAQASPPHLHQQYAPPPAPAPILPNFPSVPTAPPIIPHSSYDSTTSVVEPPKKEALLIEL